MNPVNSHADLVLVTGDGLRTLVDLIVTKKLQARRNGVPIPAMVAELETVVTQALAAQRTLRGHATASRDDTWVSTAEYAARRGVSERTARRWAQRTGRKVRGAWQIPTGKA